MSLWRALLLLCILATLYREGENRKTCRIFSRKPCRAGARLNYEDCYKAGCCNVGRFPYFVCHEPGESMQVGFSATVNPPRGFYGYYQAFLRHGGEPGYPGASLVLQCFPYGPGIDCTYGSSDRTRGSCYRKGCCFDEKSARCIKGIYRILRLPRTCRPGFANPPRCEAVNECECSPCRNDGKCTDKINGFSCQCVEPFFGTTCEQECLSPDAWCPDGTCQTAQTLCLDGSSTCNPAAIDGTASCAECVPSARLCGNTCYEEIPLCAVQDCAASGGLECSECVPSARLCGNTCYEEIPLCAVQDCAASGGLECSSCLDDNILCTGQCLVPMMYCPAGETVCLLPEGVAVCDLCKSFPCLNGGTCTNTVDGFTCQCMSPAFGTTCDMPCTSPRAWCPNNTCQNPQMLCKVGSSTCDLASTNDMASCDDCVDGAVLCADGYCAMARPLSDCSVAAQTCNSKNDGAVCST